MEEQIYMESPRLLIRSWKDADTETYIQMNLDPLVMKYFPSTVLPADTALHIQKIKSHFEIYHYGLYALELKSEKKFIGYTGFSHPSFEAYFTPCVEIGWRIDAAYWKKGLGTEAASACMNYGFTNLNFEKVYSFTSIHNSASEKLMQKIGMIKIDEFNHPALEKEHFLCKHVLYVKHKNTH